MQSFRTAWKLIWNCRPFFEETLWGLVGCYWLRPLATGGEGRLPFPILLARGREHKESNEPSTVNAVVENLDNLPPLYSNSFLSAHIYFLALPQCTPSSHSYSEFLKICVCPFRRGICLNWMVIQRDVKNHFPGEWHNPSRKSFFIHPNEHEIDLTSHEIFLVLMCKKNWCGGFVTIGAVFSVQPVIYFLHFPI